MAVEIRFAAMGCECHVIVVGGRPLLAEVARRRVEQLDRRWSRFRPDSELSLLNRHAGRVVGVSDETLLLTDVAIRAWHLTGGAFDPTLLGALEAAGYDRSIELLAPPGEVEPPTRTKWAPTRGCGALLDPPSSPRVAIVDDGVIVEGGAGFDSGGVGKGLAADMVLAELLASGAEGACVNLGGDLRVGGAAPTGSGWTVTVEHPWAEHDPIARLGLRNGAVATSTTLRRRWLSRGEVRHHLIDPRTGMPSDSDINLVTVISGEGWVAEALAKAVLLNGSGAAFNILGGTAAQGLAVTDGGDVLATSGLASYLGEGTLPETVPSPSSSLSAGARRLTRDGLAMQSPGRAASPGR